MVSHNWGEHMSVVQIKIDGKLVRSDRSQAGRQKNCIVANRCKSLRLMVQNSLLSAPRSTALSASFVGHERIPL